MSQKLRIGRQSKAAIIGTATLLLGVASQSACGSSNTVATNSAEPTVQVAAQDKPFSDASPSYSALSIDLTADGQSSTALTSAMSMSSSDSPTGTTGGMSADACHPYLFVRTDEVASRLNLHLSKFLGRIDDSLTYKTPVTPQDGTRVWERTMADGVGVRYTVTQTGELFTWTLELKNQTIDYVKVFWGSIDRTGATAPNQGTGSYTLDLTALGTVVTNEKVSGKVTASFASTSTSRTMEITADSVVWEVTPTLPDGGAMPDQELQLLQQPRNGHYVYFSEPGNGGSFKIKDQMVFTCPANPQFKLADVELVNRWYKASDGARHGRSDAMVENGQLPDQTPPIARIVAVTCQSGGARAMPTDSYWLMKAEDATGATMTGLAYDSTMQTPPVAASVCDSAFGSVPLLTDASQDFDLSTVNFTDATTVPFPGE